MERVLILGGSGLVGTAVQNVLDADRYDVYSTYFVHPVRENGEKSVYLDVSDSKNVEELLLQLKPDIVISSLRGDYDKQYAAHEIIAAYLKEHGGSLYFFSTANVFDNDLSRPHDESDPPDSQTDYGQYKARCEQKITELLGDRACILRLPQVWGRDSRRLRELINALHQREEIVVYPDLFYNTNTDEMIAKQLCCIIDRGLKGIFHLAAEDVISYRTFYAELAAKLGFPDARLREDGDEKGYFALASIRCHEFPKVLRITNQMVIDHLTT